MNRRGFFRSLAAAAGAAAAATVGVRAASAASCQALVVDRYLPELHAQIAAQMQQAEINMQAYERWSELARQQYERAIRFTQALSEFRCDEVAFPFPAIEAPAHAALATITQAAL